MASGAAHPAVLSIKYGDTPPANIAQRVRAIGAEIDPSLQMRRVVPLSAFYDEMRSADRAIALAVGFVTAAVLLLSAAGVHAMMSFTIAQRTREIGIRSALGSQPRHLLLGIFRGAMQQQAGGDRDDGERDHPERPGIVVFTARRPHHLLDLIVGSTDAAISWSIRWAPFTEDGTRRPAAGLDKARTG
jgi:hypothetical protein